MAELSDLIEMRRGRVTVAVLPSISTSLLADALLLFRTAHPAIDISIRDDVAASIVGLVREARADFGIGLATGDMTDLEAIPLTVDRLMLVCRSDHPLAARPAVNWRDLAEEAVIAFAAGSSVRPLMERAFAENGMTLRPAIEAAHLSSAEGLVLKGLGVSVLPSTRALVISEPELTVKPLHDPFVTRDLVLLQRAGRTLSPAAQVLKRELMRLAGEQSGQAG